MLFLAAAVITAAAGLTGSGKRIEVLHSTDALTHNGMKKKVLLIGGIDGSQSSARFVRQQFAKLNGSGRFAVSAIPLANPDNVRLAFPPPGEAYAHNTESHYLWRFIGCHAPDLVVIAGPNSSGLAKSLAQFPVAGAGLIPAAAIGPSTKALNEALKSITQVSQAREEMRRRLARSPAEMARILTQVYGHELKEPVYIPAMALIGRLRLGGPEVLEDVERLAAPYVSGGRNSLDKATSSHLSGHLVFAELAERTKDPRYLNLVRAAAGTGFDQNDEPRESMPYHSEMSDSVFMGVPILVKAGKLTGEPRYFAMALKHLKFMQELCLRPDGIYRHSPLDQTAWGRGNGFPALGLSFALDDLPDGPGRQEMLESLRKHLAALLPQQDETGMWRQVIDLPGSYREFSATAMIGYAMAKGVRLGWLEATTYKPAAERAWAAIKTRVSDKGEVIDVCTNTGKQRTLQDYLNRPAILGVDARAGAMALLFATEWMEAAR